MEMRGSLQVIAAKVPLAEASQELIEVEEFSDALEAMARYTQVEREHFEDPSVEIVLVAADSRDTIRHTHASYFRGEVALEELDLDKLLA
ncbi:MAG: hypothetical protein ACE5GC_03925, partial [Acidimicrobiia bacterium]